MATPAKASVLTVNSGSSSIKFALFQADDSLRRVLEGRIERIGLSQPLLVVKGVEQRDNFSRAVTMPGRTAAMECLLDWLKERTGCEPLIAIGHRIVQGGPKYSAPQRITPEMVGALRQLSPFDPGHLPDEILLTEAFHRRYPDLPQIACFDTAFHHDMPRVARLLPIPCRYPPCSADLARWSSREALAKTRPRFTPAYAKDSASSASICTSRATRRLRG